MNDVAKNIKLTIEEINTLDCFRDLSLEQKHALISFVYDLSITLYQNHKEAE
jgi:hypothetical protein